MPTTSSRPVPSGRRVLVIGATGLVGREVVRALRERGATPAVLVRDPARLGSREGVEVVVGDLRDAASVRRAVAGADVVFHVSPHEPDEVALTTTVVEACEAAGTRLVFAGVHAVGRTALHGWLLRRLYGVLLPRYRGKLALARRVERSATDPVVLVPSNFMQNDEVLLDVLRAGEHVHPAHPKGLNRVDLRDLGEVAARILLDPEFPSGTHAVVGPRSLTGPECARIWSEALGHPVAYRGDDDEALDRALRAHLTGHRLEDWRSSMRVIRRMAVVATPAQLADTERLLGRRPTDLREMAARVVAEHALGVG